ncbi:MAG: MerR family transcriptional regulator [Patulibacter minatonensis]
MSLLSMDALVGATGLSPETIERYEQRGLLDPRPLRDVRERYALAHVHRLNLIVQLQAEGLSLDFIERLVREREHAGDHLLELRQRVLDGLADASLTTTVEALVARFGDFGGQVLDRAIAGRLLVLREDGLIDVPAPKLLDVAERAVAAGVSLASAVEAAAAVREACLNASGAFLQVILKEVWAPFEAAGYPDEQVLDVARRMLSLRDLAQSVFDATLPSVLVQVFDRPFDEDLDMARAMARGLERSAPAA